MVNFTHSEAINNTSIAIFTWGLAGDALSNITAAISQGFWNLGVRNIYILYLKDNSGGKHNFPSGANLVHLGVKQTRWSMFPLAKFIKQVQPDFFISLAFLNFSAIMGRMLAGKVRTKLVISQQHSLLYKAQVEHKGEFLAQAQLWLAKPLYQQVHGLVATSNNILQEITSQVGVKLPSKHQMVIPNCVDIEAIVAQTKTQSNHPWLQNKQQPVIVSVARLATQKNFPLLLKALTIVRQHLDAKLIIWGEGSQRENLEDMIAKLGLKAAVDLPGFVKSPWTHAAKGDLFVLSSEEEGFGLVLVEAMACELPVIATDAIGGGPREILEGGKHGILIPSNDAESLAQAMIKVLKSSDVNQQLIAASKERCQAFNPAIVAQKWWEFLVKGNQE